MAKDNNSIVKRAKAKGGPGHSGSGQSGYGFYVEVGVWTPRVATVGSPGGGNPLTIPEGYPFAGRQSGGGLRDQIWGNTRYGSGYPYGSTGGNTVKGRPFPFGFTPIIFTSEEYFGNSEYRDHEAHRPGGSMHQALIKKATWNTMSKRQASSPDNATAPYYLVGDYHSIHYMLDPLYTACGVAPTSSQPIDFANPFIKPEQMIQYYRASSFGLALSTFYSFESALSHAPKTNESMWHGTTNGYLNSTIIPAGTDMAFLGCLNATISGSLPIMDPMEYLTQPSSSNGLRGGGGLSAVALLWIGLHYVGLL